MTLVPSEIGELLAIQIQPPVPKFVIHALLPLVKARSHSF